jgi:predicted dehydrogenase
MELAQNNIGVAFIGCGYVADYYLRTLQSHSQLQLCGVFDKIEQKTKHFADYFKVKAYQSLNEVLQDNKVQIVVNLTNPKNHFEVSYAALQAGKHVYSEKPFAMNFNDCVALCKLASEKKLFISGAPCSLLSETAQTIWRALRQNKIGAPRVVYAEMDDGPVHLMPYQKWLSESGTPWPWKDEFEVGCTLEHAGYYLSWFPAFFGSATEIVAFGDTLVPDKRLPETLDSPNDDFTVACVKFENGTVVRLTCGIMAPHNHTLLIVGDEGSLSIKDSWFYESPVVLKTSLSIGRRRFEGALKRKVKLARTGHLNFKYRGSHKMDFSRGVLSLAQAIQNQTQPTLSSEYVLHVNEMVLAIQYAKKTKMPYQMKTKITTIEPESWAK